MLHQGAAQNYFGQLAPAVDASRTSDGGQSASNANRQASSQQSSSNEINFEFKLIPFNDEDLHLRMTELPKKLKYSNRNKTILTVKKHIHNYLDEPVDNIEILCKNFPVADSHTLEFVKKTKWQNSQKCLVLMYRRKQRLNFSSAL